MSEGPHFLVIGMADGPLGALDPALAARVRSARAVSGGKRHHQLVEPWIDPQTEWIDITVPIDGVIERYRQIGDGEIVVFASGDPLFFGFGATLQRYFPQADIETVPAFNSLQTLCHRVGEPYGTMRCVSLTGRPWPELDAALIEGVRLVGVLTDRQHTPATIARRMADYGYTNYELIVGERLGHPDERVSRLTVTEAIDGVFESPNCLLLKQTAPRVQPFGLADSTFDCLDGRPAMITKMPIRLTTLAMLDLPGRRQLWDVGFCTGSISIEARLRFPRIGITAFERRAEGATLMAVNSRRFGAPGIETMIGDFMSLDVSRFPRPDAVFIGGHGGHLEPMVAKIKEVLLPGGVVVFNSVSEESLDTFRRACAASRLTIAEEHRIALDNYNLITIVKAYDADCQ